MLPKLEYIPSKVGCTGRGYLMESAEGFDVVLPPLKEGQP